MDDHQTVSVAEAAAVTSERQESVTFLVVGGGIAGVSCAETLAICCPEQSILLLTETHVVKSVSNLQPIARYLYKFDIKESSIEDASFAASIRVKVDRLQHIEGEAHWARTSGGLTIKYQYLCLCTGGQPRLIDRNNPRVLGIRDTESVMELQKRLIDAKNIVIVGNGGIASEMAHELSNVHVDWVVKDNHIASTFVDPGAAHFLLQTANRGEDPPKTGAVKRLRYAELVEEQRRHTQGKGSALGPDWHRNFVLSGCLQKEASPSLPTIHYKEHITSLTTSGEQLQVHLSSGVTLQSDFLVSATGVEPRHEYTIDREFQLAADGGILVDEMMATNLSGIYAAGDVCTAGWTPSENWFQMRLWTQARQMGSMAGRSMAATFEGERVHQDFCFELFGHVTKLFGYQVVLLGHFNGQGLGSDYEILLRSTPGKEYIKFVLHKGRLRGAILIGDTDLAETCENLILNGIDLTPFGDDILNPDIDIEDYFD